MSKKCIIFCLLAIMALATFLRLWQIKTIPPGFYPDEAMNGNNAMEAWGGGDFKIFYPENNGREGLWINMTAPLMAIFGNEPWVPRSMAAVFGILTILGLYFLTFEISRSQKLALLASFFLATSFWHINFSRISFRAILVPFFLVWSFYFLWRAVAKAKFLNSLSLPSLRSGARPRLEFKNLLLSPAFAAALAGIVFGLGFHTYITYRIAPLLLIVPFALMWKDDLKKYILVFLIFAFIAVLPLGLYFLKNPQDFLGRASQVSIFISERPLKDLGANIAKTIGMFFVRGDYNWRHNLAGAPQLWWPTAILFITGMVISLKGIFKNHKSQIGFLFSWLIIMLLPAVISNEGIPHALRSLAVVPAVMIFAALGLEWLMTKVSDWFREKAEQYPEKMKQLRRIKKEFYLLLFLLFISAASNAFNQYFLRWAANANVEAAFNENYLELGKYLNRLPANIPKYVIVNANGVDVRGVPMPAQTVMFATKTFLPEGQREKNIFYILPENLDSFIQKANRKDHFFITMLENDPYLRLSLKENISGLKIDAGSGIITLYK